MPSAHARSSSVAAAPGDDGGGAGPDERGRVRHGPHDRGAGAERGLERRGRHPRGDRQDSRRAQRARGPAGGRHVVGLDRHHDAFGRLRRLGPDRHARQVDGELGAPRRDRLHDGQGAGRRPRRAEQAADEGRAHVASTEHHQPGGGLRLASLRHGRAGYENGWIRRGPDHTSPTRSGPRQTRRMCARAAPIGSVARAPCGAKRPDRRSAAEMATQTAARRRPSRKHRLWSEATGAVEAQRRWRRRVRTGWRSRCAGRGGSSARRWRTACR